MARRVMILVGLLGCACPSAPATEPAVVAGSAVATVGGPLSSSVPSASVEPTVEAAVATVKDLIVKHDEEAIRSALTPAFIESVPVPEQIAFFDRVLARGGRCTTHALEEVVTPRKARFRFDCEKMGREVTVGVERDAPHRISYLLIKPARVAAIPAEMHPAMGATIARIKDLIAKHDEQALRDAFTPSFSEKIPLAEQIAVLDAVYASAGRCTEHSMQEMEKPTRVRLRFDCEKGDVSVTVGIEDEPPHRIDRLLLRPSP